MLMAHASRRGERMSHTYECKVCRLAVIEAANPERDCSAIVA
jgi:hypothetical protein